MGLVLDRDFRGHDDIGEFAGPDIRSHGNRAEIVAIKQFPAQHVLARTALVLVRDLLLEIFTFFGSQIVIVDFEALDRKRQLDACIPRLIANLDQAPDFTGRYHMTVPHSFENTGRIYQHSEFARTLVDLVAARAGILECINLPTNK